MTLAKDTHLFLSSFRISSFNNFDCSRSLCSLPETNKTNAKRAATFERRKISRSNRNISSVQSFLAKTSTRTQTTELHSTTEATSKQTERFITRYHFISIISDRLDVSYAPFFAVPQRIFQLVFLSSQKRTLRLSPRLLLSIVNQGTLTGGNLGKGRAQVPDTIYSKRIYLVSNFQELRELVSNFQEPRELCLILWNAFRADHSSVRKQLLSQVYQLRLHYHEHELKKTLCKPSTDKKKLFVNQARVVTWLKDWAC